MTKRSRKSKKIEPPIIKGERLVDKEFADAQKQATANSQQHLKNRLGEINNAVAEFKQVNINVMKDYMMPSKVEGEADLWDEAIDFYNLGDEPVVSLGEEVKAEEVKEDYIDSGF